MQDAGDAASPDGGGGSTPAAHAGRNAGMMGLLGFGLVLSTIALQSGSIFVNYY
jgi:hypothetical protein